MVKRAGFLNILAAPVASVVIVMAIIVVALSGQGHAQQSGVPEQEQNVEPNLQAIPEKGDKESLQTPPSNQGLSLDALFLNLKQEADANKARRIELLIWRRWGMSGSDTVDLLMNWAAVAMEKKEWAVGLDLLDQVVVLAPQYAEGWNRRATLYFLQSHYGRSIHDIEQVLKLETRHFGAIAGLANILQKIGDDKRALFMWKKVLELYPANQNAKKIVAILEEKLSGQGI